MRNMSEQQLAELCSRWLGLFEQALHAGTPQALRALFEQDSYWRDVLTFTWHLNTVTGADTIAQSLLELQPDTQARNFQLCPGRTPPRLVMRGGRESIEALFEFETHRARSSGVMRLVVDASDSTQARVWTLSTNLDELVGFEERLGSRRPKGESYARNFGGPNWLDYRDAARKFADHDPTVIVVGGGQAGLGIAARLGQLGIDTLIVDRGERVGDNWRKRYHSLTLHNEVHVNHLPYMPFPETWPVYIPKDKLANWFEAYVEAMELNYWTSTEFLSGDYDEAGGHWAVRLRDRFGIERIMHPRHVVMATGVSGLPNMPQVAGLDQFAGELMHASQYTEGSRWRDRKALILGTGNSAHDIAHDLHGHGAHPTLVQRSPTTIVSVEPSGQLVYSLYSEGPPTDDCDLIAASVPYPLLKRGFQLLVERMTEHDRELLDALENVGFRMDIGDDATGFQMKYLRRGGGYYMNVGCSELVVSGAVGLLQFDTIEHFDARGAQLKNGDHVTADLVVLATGYQGQQELVRHIFGDTIADRVGPIWGFDEAGELRNMWKRTAQAGLWFTAGSLAQSRIFSKYLALQIKACEEGLIDKHMPAAKASAKLAIAS
jgi:hypothetical protein